MAFLEIDRLSMRFDLPNGASVQALKDVSLTLKSGELLSVLGPSGCGKTTLLNLIGALDVPSGGQVVVGGRSIVGASRRELTRFRRENIGFIFQQFNLIPTLTAVENVSIHLILKGVSTAQAEKRACEVLEKVGLADKYKSYPSQLSGGQQQRVAIARALITEPKLILADEPTGNLDSEQGNEVMEMLSEQNEKGTTIVMATHNYNDATYSRRIIKMLDGQLLSENRSVNVA